MDFYTTWKELGMKGLFRGELEGNWRVREEASIRYHEARMPMDQLELAENSGSLVLSALGIRL